MDLGLTAPAIVIGIIYLLLTIVIGISMKGQSAGAIIGTLIFWLLSAILLVYDTNCLVIGGCTVWAWVRMILYSIIPVLLIILFLAYLANKTDEEETKETNDTKKEEKK